MKYKIKCKYCGKEIKDVHNLAHKCKGTYRKSGYQFHIDLDLSLDNKNDQKVFKLFSFNEILILSSEDIFKIVEEMNKAAKKMIEDAENKNKKFPDWGTQFPVTEFPEIQYPGFPEISPSDLEKSSNKTFYQPGGTYSNPCEGCPQYERVKRGENVVCHCTIPYFKRPIICY